MRLGDRIMKLRIIQFIGSDGCLSYKVQEHKDLSWKDTTGTRYHKLSEAYNERDFFQQKKGDDFVVVA